MPTATPSLDRRPDRRDERRVTGRTVLLWLLAFFAVIFAANGVFIYLAVSSFPGLEVASSYKAGLDFESEAAAARAQDARGWAVDATTVRDGDGARVRVTFADRSGAPERALAVTAHFEHPTDSRHDRDLALAETDAGVYEGRVDGLLAGRWTLVLEAAAGGERLFRSRNAVALP